MVTGKMTRPTALESTVTLMELATRATGKRINSMARVLRLGQTEQATREITSRAAKTERAASRGQTRALTQGTLLRIILKVKVSGVQT